MQYFNLASGHFHQWSEKWCFLQWRHDVQ